MTGLLQCAVCNGVMYGNKVKDSHFYRCDTPKCSNSASGTGVDAWVGERVVERNELVTAQATPATTAPDARLVALNTQIDDSNAMIKDVMAAYRNKDISATTAFGNIAKLEESLVPVAAERDAC